MKSIRNKLSLATCSLLTTGNAAAEAIENAWDLDSSYLYYSEVDRITVNKLIGSAKGFVSTKDTAAIKVVFDAMSGATPTGAVKSGNPLTSTGASGGTGPVGGGDILIGCGTNLFGRHLLKILKILFEILPANLNLEGCQGPCQAIIAAHPVDKIALV